jgi:hypothetical protein
MRCSRLTPWKKLYQKDHSIPTRDIYAYLHFMRQLTVKHRFHPSLFVYTHFPWGGYANIDALLLARVLAAFSGFSSSSSNSPMGSESEGRSDTDSLGPKIPTEEDPMPAEDVKAPEPLKKEDCSNKEEDRSNKDPPSPRDDGVAAAVSWELSKLGVFELKILLELKSDPCTASHWGGGGKARELLSEMPKPPKGDPTWPYSGDDLKLPRDPIAPPVLIGGREWDEGENKLFSVNIAGGDARDDAISRGDPLNVLPIPRLDVPLEALVAMTLLLIMRGERPGGGSTRSP